MTSGIRALALAMGKPCSRCSLLLVALALLASGCWPGRCGGALRGTPMVHFTGEHAPCTTGPECAEPIEPETGFHQRGDFARVDDPSALISESGLDAESWFLVDQSGARIPARVSAVQHGSAHSCASAIGFDLEPERALAPGVYRLVLLVERVRWPVLRQGVALTSWEGQPAVVQFYEVGPASPGA